MADRVGQQLGNYRLLHLIGQGGFADVYLGVHVHLNTQAAIKVLQMRLIESDLEQFRTEARTIASLVHPNIVRVLDFDVENGIPFLVMDYAPNGTLRQRHPRGVSLPLATMVHYVKHVATALQYSHDRKLVHRDVKPENMLLGRTNEVLLSDFGLVWIAQSSSTSGFGSTQEMGGTIPYTAPEQLRGKARPASDQYSLGIVAYEWLSGERPFTGSFVEIVGQHMFVPPPPLHGRIPGISPTLEEVVLTALAKDPQDRFASVQVFATAFEQACQNIQADPLAASNAARSLMESGQSTHLIPPSQSSLPTFVIPPSNLSSPVNVMSTPTNQLTRPTVLHTPPGISSQPTYIPPLSSPSPQTPLPNLPATPSSPPPAPARRISRRAILAGLAGFIAVGGGAGYLALSQKLGASFIPSGPFGAATPKGIIVTPSTRSSVSPTAKATATPTPSPTQPPGAPAPGTTLLTYRGHSNSVNGVAWSPNGSRIASASDDYTVQVWNASNGGNVLIYGGQSGLVEAVAWSPDGSHIASGGGPVDVWNAATGSRIYTYGGHSLIVYTVAWSPDSSRIAAASADGTVQVWDATTGGHVYTYRGHSSGASAVAWSPGGKRIASTGENVQVWDAADGGNVYTYRGHSGGVRGVAWSPDGSRIASASTDGTAQVWDATSGSHIYTYSGHPSGVNGVAWSPSGLRIASAGYDGTVQVWDATTGGHVLIYHGHSRAVNGVAWSPNGSRIASGSTDGTVQVWQAE